MEINDLSILLVWIEFHCFFVRSNYIWLPCILNGIPFNSDIFTNICSIVRSNSISLPWLLINCKVFSHLHPKWVKWKPTKSLVWIPIPGICKWLYISVIFIEFKAQCPSQWFKPYASTIFSRFSFSFCFHRLTTVSPYYISSINGCYRFNSRLFLV